jgi:hypothetical protein
VPVPALPLLRERPRATFTSQHALAATPAGQRCGPRGLTAAAFTPSGALDLAGTCTRPGTAGIFTLVGGAWQLSGLALPPALAREDIAVPRLTQTAHGDAALLAAGTGPGASLLVAWTTGRAETITSTHSQWQPLPLLPAGTLTHAPGAGGATEALAAHRSTLTVWQLTPDGRGWATAQTMNVPIQYGSSN